MPTPCLWVGWGIWAGGPWGTAPRGWAVGSASAQEEQGSFTVPKRNADLLVFLLENRSSSSQSAAWLIPDDIIFQVSHDLFIFFGSDCYKGVCVFVFCKAALTWESQILPAVRKLHKLQ